MAGIVWRGVLLLCWHRLGCGSEDRALALYIRDAWLRTTNWGTSTNRRPIEPTDGTGRRPQRHRQIRSTLSDTCHGPPTRPFSPRPKASPTGRPYLARVGSGLRRFSVPLLLITLRVRQFPTEKHKAVVWACVPSMNGIVSGVPCLVVPWDRHFEQVLRECGDMPRYAPDRVKNTDAWGEPTKPRKPPVLEKVNVHLVAF